jgi:hypothetical protein
MVPFIWLFLSISIFLLWLSCRSSLTSNWDLSLHGGTKIMNYGNNFFLGGGIYIRNSAMTSPRVKTHVLFGETLKVMVWYLEINSDQVECKVLVWRANFQSFLQFSFCLYFAVEQRLHVCVTIFLVKFNPMFSQDQRLHVGLWDRNLKFLAC